MVNSQFTGTDGFPELSEVEPTHCEQAEIVAAVAGPMPLYPRSNNRAFMGDLHPANTCLQLYHTPAPSGCIYEPGPVFSSGLSTEIQISLPSLCAHQQGVPWEGECSDGHGPSVLVSLSSACCKLAGALSSEPLNLPICPSWSPGWLRVFPG